VGVTGFFHFLDDLFGFSHIAGEGGEGIVILVDLCQIDYLADLIIFVFWFWTTNAQINKNIEEGKIISLIKAKKDT